MIKALLLRRMWLIRHRFMTTLAFMVLLPLMLHVSITMVMKNILVHSLGNVPYDIWVFPGILLLIAVSSTFSMIYRDLFDLRIHKKSFIPITMAPYSKSHLVMGFLTTSIIEAYGACWQAWSKKRPRVLQVLGCCLLYTSDAADE